MRRVWRFLSAPVRSLPLWTSLFVALFFIPLVWLHEPVFGDGSGLIAAGGGVVLGLSIGIAASAWRWRPISIVAAVLAAYFIFGGLFALPSTTLFRVVPTWQTFQILALGIVRSWKDLLTVEPPVGTYVGVAIVPWLSGLVLSCFAVLISVRGGRALLGSIPLLLFGGIGVAWGLGGVFPPAFPAIVWMSALLCWWAYAAQKQRFQTGEDVLIGRQALRGDTESSFGDTTTLRSQARSVNMSRQMLGAMLTVVIVGAGTGLSVYASGPWNQRVVLRDIVDPPLNVYEFPSPLSAFRRIATDLSEETVVEVSALPENARVRFAALDMYDGTTFGIAPSAKTGRVGYVPVPVDLPRQDPPEGSVDAEAQIKTRLLTGPWVPTFGIPQRIEFLGDHAADMQRSLYVDRWADTALSAQVSPERVYTIASSVPPVWSDGQLSGVNTAPYVATHSVEIPQVISELAAKITQPERSSLGKARAIERYLSQEGFYSQEDHSQSRPGHRIDRLVRMLDAEQLIGDDEQYAALMALMLHSQGINARVVMGAYPETPSEGAVELRGSDVHVWVEVEFEGVGWGLFDPAPPRDQVPQTEVPKPRSVPRPQVLQPPEPPEEPAELPPGTSDRGSKSDSQDALSIPWGIIVGTSVSILVFLAPLAVILLMKMSRRRKRRLAQPASSMAGCWDEIIDLAVDSGASVDVSWTRQETARHLVRTTWGQAMSGQANAQWELDSHEVPRVEKIARVVDFVTFSSHEAQREQADLLWNEVYQARTALNSSQPLGRRIRRALSLKSLRMRRRLRRKKTKGISR